MRSNSFMNHLKGIQRLLLGKFIMNNVFEKQKIIDIHKYGKYLIYRRESRPLMMSCETINICNNKCIICTNRLDTQKKEIMSMELFEKVLKDYSEMGGGKLSLTPRTGELFLDPHLADRLRLIRKYPKITGLSVTTNAVLADQFNEHDLRFIVNNFEKIQISTYGLDEEEYFTMTQRNVYSKKNNRAY